jgi:CBS domain-containing protein
MGTKYMEKLYLPGYLETHNNTGANMDLADIPIKDAAAHIFRRPFLFVNPTAPMMQIATLLAIGPQIYVDGLVVINESKQAIGRISSKHIIFNIIVNGYPGWLGRTAEQIMDDFAATIDMNSPLSKAIEVFDKTRFAFVPIIAKDDIHGGSEAEVIASLSIRDILPIVAKANIDRSIKDLSSPLLSVDKKMSVRDAIDLMFKDGIRNIGIKENTDNDDYDDNRSSNSNKTKLLCIINDRKILEFLLSHNGKEIMRKNGIAGLADIDTINHLDMIAAKNVKYDTTVSMAARLLMDIGNPFLILEDRSDDYSIVTPWDIVMKTMKSDHHM